jgi:hypothetical protein
MAKWKSKQQYEHPAPHQAGVYGTIEQSDAGVYVLKVGGGRMSCPQDWAARIHAEEGQDESDTRRGRKRVGDTLLDPLTVWESTKSALEAKAQSLGISVPDARREAYELWLRQ